MKTKLLFLVTFLLSAYSFAQTTVNYPQRVANYTTFTVNSGIYDDDTDQIGMWANGAAPQQVVA